MDFHGKFDCPCLLGHKHTQEIPLLPNSPEYFEVIGHATKRMRQHIQRVTKICSPTLYAWFTIKKAEYESRGYRDCTCTLLHVTASENVNSILRKNLNYRLVKRAKYGKGVSFSNNAGYANNFSSNNNGSQRALIVADVLIGNAMPTEHRWTIPPIGVDTTMGNRHVFVKYNDDEFYPKYVIYYHNN